MPYNASVAVSAILMGDLDMGYDGSKYHLLIRAKNYEN